MSAEPARAPDEPLEVLCFGESIVDFFPERPGQPLAECELFRRHLGGAPTNVAVALARQGIRVGLMNLVGPDDFGRFVRAELAAEGVDTRAVGTHAKHKTAITFVAVSEAGERSFMFFRHPSADQSITPEDVAAHASTIERARVFHCGSSTMAREPGRAATQAAFARALAAGAFVSMDPNLRRHLWEQPEEAPALIRELAARCDLVKVSDDEIGPLLGEATPERAASALRDLGAKIAIVTLGARGCYFEADGGRGHVAGVPARVVDVTGAGDAFVAGVLAELSVALAAGATAATLDEGALRAACTRGTVLGAGACTALGALTAVPRR